MGCVCVCVCPCGSVAVSVVAGPSPLIRSTGAGVSWSHELPTRILGTVLRPSAGVVHSLNPWGLLNPCVWFWRTGGSLSEKCAQSMWKYLRLCSRRLYVYVQYLCMYWLNMCAQVYVCIRRALFLVVFIVHMRVLRAHASILEEYGYHCEKCVFLLYQGKAGNFFKTYFNYF